MTRVVPVGNAREGRAWRPRRAARYTILAAFACIGFGGTPVAGQVVLGTGIDYLGYSFEDGLGADAVQLFMVPVAARIPLGSSLTFDVYSAWAEGRVEEDRNVLRLSGVVDTSVKLSVQATPWALLSIGANLPTGNASHDTEEALVASVLSTDLFGFRETTWGTGFAFTSSVASAVTAGGFGIGIAAAYAARSPYEPSAGTALTYQPGNEARVRVGVDRSFGSSSLTLGATFINYTEDRADDLELFRAGNRLRFDAAYAFRAGSGVWTVYAADLVRANGDLRLGAVGDPGEEFTVTTAKQNLITGGVLGTFSLGGGFVFRPHVDVTVQQREESDGNRAGSGWMIAAGGDIPIRLGGSEFFPKARVYFGSMQNAAATPVGLMGMEFRGTIRTAF